MTDKYFAIMMVSVCLFASTGFMLAGFASVDTSLTSGIVGYILSIIFLILGVLLARLFKKKEYF